MGIRNPPDLHDTEIQGDVLPGFRHRDDVSFTQRFVFFRVTDADAARRGLALLLPRISSANDLRRTDDAGYVADPAVNVAFTWGGLEAIGLDARWKEEFDRHKAFKEGLWRRTKRLSDLLGDPKPWAVTDRADDVHIVVNVGGTDPKAVERSAALIESDLCANGFEWRACRAGVLRPLGIEPFGFADGLSQPLVEGYHGPPRPAGQMQQAPFGEAAGYPTQLEVERTRRLVNIEASNFSKALRSAECKKVEQWFARRTRRAGAPLGAQAPVTPFSPDGRPFLPPSRFLVNPPIGEEGPDGFTANGSFMVWIRFVQDLNAFQAHCAAVASQLSAAWGRRVTRDEVAALEVGRRKDGTSMIDRPLFKRSRGNKASEAFRYLPDDASGQSCPLAAHARKMNPRTIEGLRRAILRRGIPFQEGNEQGLLFVCYQASIDEQYEKLQRQWANWSYEPERNASPDPVISQVLRERHGRIEIRNFDRRGSTPVTVKNDWVVPTAGLYLFVPSVRGLQALAGPATPG